MKMMLKNSNDKAEIKNKFKDQKQVFILYGVRTHILY